MFVDPNDLSEEKFDKLVDLALDCFSENVSLLAEMGTDPRLVKYITTTFAKSDIAVMIDIPHPEWWPDHEMYAEATGMDAPQGPADASAATADPAATGDSTNSVASDTSLDDETNLGNYIELSVVATPNEDSADEEQVVLASLLLPSFWVEEMDKPDADPSILDALELQWLPERNTLDN